MLKVGYEQDAVMGLGGTSSTLLFKKLAKEGG